MAVRAGVNIWTAPAPALQNPELSSSFSRTETTLPGLVSVASDRTVSTGALPSLQGSANRNGVGTELPSLRSIVLNEGRTVGAALPTLSSFVPGQINVEDATLPSLDSFAGDTNAASSDTTLPGLIGAASVEIRPSFSFSSGAIAGLRSGFIIGSVTRPSGVEEASLPSAIGFGGDIVGAVSTGRAPGLVGRSRSLPAMLVVTLPGMSGGLNTTELRIEEQVYLADTTAGTLAVVINEILAIQADAATSLFGKIEITEQTVALALAAIPYNLGIVEALILDDDPETAVLKLVQAVEALAAVDDSNSQGILLLSTVLALAIGDKVKLAELLSFEELLQVVDDNKANLVAAAQVVEELLCTPLAGDNGVFVVASAETLAALDTGGTAAQLRVAIEEGLAVYVRFKVGEDEFQGWVMNAKEAGFTQYDNFPFNSFAKLRGEVYAASDTGIYKLGGDTDAGEQIDARLKTGLLDLGSHKMKNVKAAYLGFTGDDRMILKVTVVDRGQKNEHWYEAIPSDAGAFRDGRVTIQQGLRSRYWQFELTNIDGADFDIDDIDFTYNVLSRGYR